MRATLTLASLCVLTACGFVREPTAIEDLEPQYGVFSLLRAGSDTVSVLVVRFPSASPTVEGVPGATVRIVDAGDTIRLNQEPTSSTACASPGFDGPTNLGGCYRAVIPGGVRTGATYHLVADVPDFGRILGSTRIPAAPAITSPGEGDRFATGFVNGAWTTIPLRVEAAPSTARLEASLVPQDANRRCEAYFIDYRGGGFGVMVLDPTDSEEFPAQFLAGCSSQTGHSQPLGELPTALRVLAFDSTYTRFAQQVFDRSSQSILERHARAGIDRGVGYFAGTAAGEVRIVLTGGGM